MFPAVVCLRIDNIELIKSSGPILELMFAGDRSISTFTRVFLLTKDLGVNAL